MDILDELEQMALNAADHTYDEAQAPSEETVIRWVKLFGYSHAGAVKTIKQHRENISRKRVSNEHWAIEREEKEAQGYDREAYEHELEISARRVKPALAKVELNGARDDVRQEYYSVRLEADVTAAVIQEVSGSRELPEICEGSIEGRDVSSCVEDRDAKFCVVDSGTRQTLQERFSGTGFEPTFVRIPRPAEKNLSSESQYPALGIDTTLPHHRPGSCDGPFFPAQDEYPLWYFFYGTLADSTVLTRHLSLIEEPKLHPASITGGVPGTWGGKYQTLVDGPESARVQGSAFRVMTKEHEVALRYYETDNYEVVRCVIEFEGRTVQGCTFRFVGEIDR
jgi:hypothetical protein